jgi:hypothetical protein
MRWTNYFTHPGDNRYHVFAFSEDEHADAFQKRLNEAGIEHERHLELLDNQPGRSDRSEWLFGVHRQYFKQALEANHLVHAQYRDKFIPSAGLRWGMLIGTLAVILLALAGAWTQRAQAQDMPNGNDWQIAISSSWIAPLPLLAGESIAVEEDGLGLAWTPTGGGSFGMRLLRHFPSAWSLETGLETMRSTSDWALTFQPGFDNGQAPPIAALSDTLSLRTSRYRMPILARTQVQLTNQTRLTAAAGISVDFLLSDAYTTGFQSVDAIYSDYLIEENRQHRVTMPLRVELGWEFLPTQKDRPGVYFGALWWREWNANRWGEATWTRQLETADVRLYMGQAAFALECRLILP